MKICVTSQGSDSVSPVDPRFGRARFFMIYDDETDTFEAVDNQQNVDAAGGAGAQSATTVAEKGCQWVISGHMGPRAMSVLKEAGVRVATGATGTVADAIREFKEGELKGVDAADVPPHW